MIAAHKQQKLAIAVRELADDLGLRLSEGAASVFVRRLVEALEPEELTAHEQAHHGTGGAFVPAQPVSFALGGSTNVKLAADPPAVEHKPDCRTRCVYWPKPFDACLVHPDGHTCDCGASDPKAGEAKVVHKEACKSRCTLRFYRGTCTRGHREHGCNCAEISDETPPLSPNLHRIVGHCIDRSKGCRIQFDRRCECSCGMCVNTRATAIIGEEMRTAPDREAPKPPELPDRITLYWARSQLGGYHIDTHGGEWNAQPLVPFEVVQVSALTEAIVALRALVNSLPKCDKCSLPATRAWDRGRERYCDKHRQPGYPPHEGIAPEYPRAEPVRRAQALIARHGVKKTTGT